MFADDIKNFVRRCGDRHVAVTREVTKRLYSEVVQRSPILTGRFRDSWRIGIDGVDDSVEEPRKNPSFFQGMGGVLPATAAEIAYADQMISQIKSTSKVYVTNSLPYTDPIEQGHSAQAPAGVMGISIEMIHGEFALIVLIATGRPL